MDKATGEPLSMGGEIIRSSFTFKPEKSDGEVVVSFLLDAGSLTKSTEIIVFETLYREGVKIAVHEDIEDEGQTVIVNILMPPALQTDDNSNLSFWIGLGSVALGGLTYRLRCDHSQTKEGRRRMKRVYICAPLGGNIDENLYRVKEYARYALKCGTALVVPHFYALCLDDNDPEERKIGDDEINKMVGGKCL